LKEQSYLVLAFIQAPSYSGVYVFFVFEKQCKVFFCLRGDSILL